MSLGQLAEFAQIFILAAQRFDHAHTGDVLVVRAGDLGVDLAHLADIAGRMRLAELDRDIHQDGNDQQDDQRQLPVDDEHEDGSR